MAGDGYAIMDAEATMTHFARSMLLHAQRLMNQLPIHLAPQLDGDKFLSAFSFRDDNTREHRQVAPWPLAPTTPEGRQERSRIWQEWQQSLRNAAQFFPEIMHDKPELAVDQAGEDILSSELGDLSLAAGPSHVHKKGKGVYADFGGCSCTSLVFSRMLIGSRSSNVSSWWNHHVIQEA